MPKHHDRRRDDVQWAKEPRPEGVGGWPISYVRHPHRELAPLSRTFLP